MVDHAIIEGVLIIEQSLNLGADSEEEVLSEKIEENCYHDQVIEAEVTQQEGGQIRDDSAMLNGPTDPFWGRTSSINSMLTHNFFICIFDDCYMVFEAESNLLAHRRVHTESQASMANGSENRP